ncbi:MAG: hypothetical protein ACTSRS_10485 [Candidatus Helarchaeota archaeon]
MEKDLKMEPEDSLQVVSKKLRPLKAILKVLGVILVFFGFLVIVLSYAVSYLMEDLPNPDELFLIIFAIGWVIFGGGLGLCFGVSLPTLPSEACISSYLKEFYQGKEKPETSVQFFSFRWSRLVAALLFLILGFLDLFIITGKISHHQPPYGNAVVLGGPSFYYVIAFFPHGFGIGLLLYALFYAHKVNVGSSEKYCYYHEFKKNSTVTAILPRNRIEMIRYQNTHLGKNYAWIITLIPFSVLTAINGVYLLMAPMLTDPTQGILFLITAVLELFALYYLALRSANYLRITTPTDYYETWFAPHKMDLTELPVSGENSKKNPSSDILSSLNINATHRNYTQLLLGCIFLLTGLLMLIFYFSIGIFGNLYTITSVIFGTALIIKAYLNDFSNKNGIHLIFHEDTKTITYEQHFRSKFFRIETFQPTEFEVINQFRKISVYDLLLVAILLIFATIETVQSWAISMNSTIILNSVITTVALIGVCFVIFLYVCAPIDQLEIRTPTYRYHIPVTKSSHKTSSFQGVFSKTLKKGFLLRCTFILLVIVGTIIGTVIYLAPFFF